MLHPFQGSRYGGSAHILTMDIPLDANIKVQLTDDSGWSAFASDVFNFGDSIQFTVPPYEGEWQDVDETRLVHIKVFVRDNEVATKSIKFLYRRI